jgi:hypothetical protein
MAESQGYSALFLLGGGLTLVGTLLFYVWYVLPRPKQPDTAVAEISSGQPL